MEALVKAAKSQEQYIILELDPSHTSTEHPWFKRSIEREEPFSSYYVWADAKITTDGKRTPPNNWVSYIYFQAKIALYLCSISIIRIILAKCTWRISMGMERTKRTILPSSFQNNTT